MDRDPHIAAHIARVAERTPAESDGLTAAAVRRSWPGGAADRSEPWGREWVRRWGPSHSLASLVACSCAAGRCGVCN
jgi:hypothetical protein